VTPDPPAGRPDAELPPPTTTKAVKLVGGGRALAHVDGATWMIRGALPDEQVRVVPVRRRDRIVEAEVVDVEGGHHPARIDDPCPHAPTCGGCDWPHVDPAAGARLKAGVAAESTGRGSPVAALLRGARVVASPPSYRLRSRLHWDPTNGVLGFYGHRSWQVSMITHCRILMPGLLALLPDLARALASRCPEPVDVELLAGDEGAVAALRPASQGPPKVAADRVPEPSQCGSLEGFHRLTGAGRLLPGWGRTEVTMAVPVPLVVPVGAFFQGNVHLAGALFRTVAELVGAGSGPVVDLHAGVGFLAAAAAWAGRRSLTAVEPHAGAADAARRNLPGARVFTTSAEDFLHRTGDLDADAVVITDPPRSGLSARLRRQLTDRRPRHLVSLGCDPATWGRDALELTAAGYRIRHLELFDLFPHTHHVEVVSVLEVA
jgi:tRNA/tmRNA/rRNA uracil-C5-methylase (TrmA/RlmC/RlmD family)